MPTPQEQRPDRTQSDEPDSRARDLTDRSTDVRGRHSGNRADAPAQTSRESPRPLEPGSDDELDRAPDDE